MKRIEKFTGYQEQLMEQGKMLCPICKSELVINGQARLETLVEHVSCIEPSLKDKYICSDIDCISHLYDICWNKYGEQYGSYLFIDWSIHRVKQQHPELNWGKDWNESCLNDAKIKEIYTTLLKEQEILSNKDLIIESSSYLNRDLKQLYNLEYDESDKLDGYFVAHLKNEIFINELSSPFNTHQRKLELEIYKKGVKKHIYLHPCLMLWWMLPVIEFSYKSNENGDVLSRNWKISYRKKDKNSNQYCIVVDEIIPIKTWKYLWNEFQSKRKSDNLKKAFEPAYNRALEYRLFETFVKYAYYSDYKKSLKKD